MCTRSQINPLRKFCISEQLQCMTPPLSPSGVFRWTWISSRREVGLFAFRTLLQMRALHQPYLLRSIRHRHFQANHHGKISGILSTPSLALRYFAESGTAVLWQRNFSYLMIMPQAFLRTEVSSTCNRLLNRSSKSRFSSQEEVVQHVPFVPMGRHR